jgi:hypothetical protein
MNPTEPGQLQKSPEPVVIANTPQPQVPNAIPPVAPIEPNSIAQSNKQHKVVGPLVVVLIGLFIFLISFFIVKAGEIPKTYLRTTGTVMSAVPTQESGPKGGTYIANVLTIKFNVNNEAYSFSEQGKNTDTRGETIPVAYNPTNPSHDPKIGRAQNHIVNLLLYLVPGIIVLVGLILLIKNLLVRSYP